MIRQITPARHSVSPLRKGFSPFRVLGADTETYIDRAGVCQMNTIQFAGDDYAPELIYTTNESALADFMAAVDSWARKEKNNVVFFHNASYDLTALLLNYPEAIDRLAEGYLKIVFPGAEFEIFAGRVWFGKITFGNKRVCKIVDSFRFSFTSLDATAKLFNVPTKKLPRPEGLGERRFHGERDFEEYSLTDAVTLYEIGKVILSQHEEFDVPLCVSAAQLSARVFRKQFLREPFVNCPHWIEEAAVLAFHGGITRARPGFYSELTEYDLTSAYPAAMAEIGIPGEFRAGTDWVGERALYRVYGRVIDRKFPALFDHDFSPAVGNPRYFWTTGYELAEARRAGEFRGSISRSIEIIPASDNALERFVDHFFRAKAEAKAAGDKTREHFYKRGILNSLFGKFIQTQESIEEPGVYNPGGLYYPVLAALITGKVRAQIHAMEHAGNAVHTATDSVKTHVRLPEGSGLGLITREVTGDCLIVRGKLYAHRGEAGKWKLAAHGLGVYPAERAWAQILETGATRKSRVVNVKTARQRHLNPLTWVEMVCKLQGQIPPFPDYFRKELREYCLK